MASDDFAFDAYDRLVGRNSMTSSPVTLVVRDPHPDRIELIIDRCLSLVAGRRFPDEILIVVSNEPLHRPPSSIGAVGIRTAVLPSISHKEGLAWTLSNGRWPLSIFVGANAELPPPSFRKMLESL